MKIRHIHFLFQFFLSQLMFSQWVKLPSITSLPSYTPPPMPSGSQTYPVDIVPAANQVILWTMTGNVSPSSGGYINYYISKNDLQTSSCIDGCNYSGNFGCCGVASLEVYNDSTYSFYSTYQGWYRIVFRNDKSNQTQSVTCPTNNSIIHLNSVTNKSAYVFSQYDYTNDTLLLVRTISTLPLNQTIVQLPKYKVNSTYKKLTFINDSIGFALVAHRNNANKKYIIKSEDFGSTWSEIMIDSINTILDFDFPSSNVGYVTKSNGTLLKTSDGGLTWNPLSPGVSNPSLVKFLNDSLGFIATGANTLLKTGNSGNTWSTEPLNVSPNQIKALHVFPQAIYLVDADKTVFKKSGNTVVNEAMKNNLSDFTIIPVPTTGTIKLTFNTGSDSKEIKISVLNSIGEKVYENFEYSGNTGFEKEIDLSELSNGVYLMEVTYSGSKKVKKLVLSKN